MLEKDHAEILSQKEVSYSTAARHGLHPVRHSRLHQLRIAVPLPM